MATIFDTLKEYINYRQKEKESLLDFTKRFKVVREVLQSHLVDYTSIMRIYHISHAFYVFSKFFAM